MPLVIRREYRGRSLFHVATGSPPRLIRFRIDRAPDGRPALSWWGAPEFVVQAIGPGRVDLVAGGEVLKIDARPDGASHCQIVFCGPRSFRVDRSEDRLLARKGTPS